MITLKQDINARDYIRAAFLHLRPRPVIGLAGLLLLALILFALFITLSSPTPWGNSTFVVLGGLLYFALYFFAFIPWRANRLFKQNRFLDHATECRIDEDGLHKQSDLGSTDIPWDHLCKWKENKKLMLLYPNDAMYFIFPRRLFDNEGWEELRKLTENNLKELR